MSLDSTPENNATAKPYIIIADDEAGILMLAKMMLGKLYPGCEVVCFPDGKAALDAYKNIKEQGGTVSLLITDMVMPELSGEDLVAAIRKEEGGQTLPILQSSGYPRDQSIVIDSHTGFLNKPYTIEKFTAAINSIWPDAQHMQQPLRPPAIAPDNFPRGRIEPGSTFSCGGVLSF